MQISEIQERDNYRSIWVVGEVRNGKVQDVTYELLGAARKLAGQCDNEVCGVLLGSGIAGAAEKLFHYQADKVIVIDDPVFENFHDEVEAKVLARLVEENQPEVLLCGATSRGRSMMARLAVMVESGLTADCTDLDMETDSRCLLVQTRPAFGGNLMATIKTEDYRPQMATVRPRVMEAAEPDTSRTGEVITETLKDDEKQPWKKILEVITGEGEGLKISDAEFIIAGGRGVKGPEGFELLDKLAKTVGGAVAATRAAVDSGWIAYPHQVGQTGQTVQPKIYIACGISGQIQHLVGMQSSDLIIAINKDPEAPIMKIADIAVVGDLFAVVPAVMEAIQAG